MPLFHVRTVCEFVLTVRVLLSLTWRFWHRAYWPFGLSAMTLHVELVLEPTLILYCWIFCTRVPIMFTVYLESGCATRLIRVCRCRTLYFTPHIVYRVLPQPWYTKMSKHGRIYAYITALQLGAMYSIFRKYTRVYRAEYWKQGV
jgi:hypothetical protein